MRKIYLYGELHGAKELGKAYQRILGEAAKNGATCHFHECPPHRQPEVEREILDWREITSQPEFDVRRAVDVIISKSAGWGLDLVALMLCARHGLQFICSDVGLPSPRLYLVYCATRMGGTANVLSNIEEALKRVDSAEMCRYVGLASKQEAQGVLDTIKQEIKAGTFFDGCEEEFKERRAADERIANYILSKMGPDDTAVVIYGRSHVENRNVTEPPSLTTMFLSRDDVYLESFFTEDGAVVPYVVSVRRPSGMQREFNPQNSPA